MTRLPYRGALFAAALVWTVGFSFAVPSVSAAVPVVFSGGGGGPISITLPQPVIFTTFQPSSVSGLFFNFLDSGDPFGDTFPTVTGDMTYSVNGGPTQSVIYANSGRYVNAIQGFIYLLGNDTGYPSGSTVVLSAGTVTTTTNFASLPPTSGNYEMFISNDTGSFISSAGVIPEPASFALLAIAGLGFAGRRRLMRRWW